MRPDDWYEVWDMASGNLLATYGTPEEARVALDVYDRLTDIGVMHNWGGGDGLGGETWTDDTLAAWLAGEATG